MWGPTVTVGNYKLYFADPQAGDHRRTPSERRPRAELIRVANSYFEGMEADIDKSTPFDKACQPRMKSGECSRLSDATEHKVNPPFDHPYSFFIAELFKIVDGKINRIEALVTPVPYGMWTGWPKK
jgi:hypothetical protein